jgi:signal transduction histidine kinase/CheY-like chemotaxis protein
MKTASSGTDSPVLDTPVQTAMMTRLTVYVHMRWLAILAIVLTTLVTSQLLNLKFPVLPIYIICGFMVLYNLALYYVTRRLNASREGVPFSKVVAYGNLNIVFDIIALTLLLHYSGGIENPFIFMYPIHAIAAGIVLPRKTTYGMAFFALIMAMLLVLLEYFQVVPHVALEGYSLGQFQQISYVAGVLAALAALLFGCTYLTSTISGELRRAQRQIVALRDQSLEKKELELENISKEVKRLEKEKERFTRYLSVAAHDLQAPLVTAKNTLWIILQGRPGPLNEEQIDLLDRINNRLSGLVALINDLLDIPRIESGQLVHEMKQISMTEVAEQSLEDMRPHAANKRLTLKVEMPRNISPVLGSSVRLQQVVNNLVDNAIKYTKAGTVRVRLTEDEDNVIVSVADSGVGISPGDLKRVFETFFRVGNTEARGTGLGLSICKMIIEAHGGKIWAESPSPDTGTGTTFYFSLPKKQAQVENIITGGTVMSKKPKILIVDDDADFRESTKMVLETKPWEIITAKDGNEGIRKAKADKPDLILLDMMMPEKDGFTAATEMKKDAALRKIPILALTSYSVQLGSPFEFDVDEYIQKSITPDQLLEKVQSHLKRIGL